MSENVEALLRRMISPNADLRCTATQAMLDSYWENDPEIKTIHRKLCSITPKSETHSSCFPRSFRKLYHFCQLYPGRIQYTRYPSAPISTPCIVTRSSTGFGVSQVAWRTPYRE